MDKSEIKTSWDLSPLFSGDDDAAMSAQRREVEEASYAFIKKWKNRSDYLSDVGVLKEALDEYESLSQNLFSAGEEGRGSAEAYYFWLRMKQDTSDPEIKAKYNKIKEFNKKIENDMRFFELKLARVPKAKQEEFANSYELARYKHFLERLFANSAHLLSEEGEKVMSLKSAVAYENWVNMLESFLLKEEREVADENGRKVLRNYSEITNLMSSQNKEVRDSAAEAYNDILSRWIDAAEAEINSVLANKKADDELRKFSRPDESRHLSDDIESEVIDSLVRAVSSKFDISRRYYALKARLFGVTKLKYHERNVQYGKIEGKYGYEDAMMLVHRTLRDIDEGFGSIAERLSCKGNTDVYPAKGKMSGGFCVYSLITHPTYILLNYTGRIEDVRTLAHELGHAINNELVRKKQHALYYGTSTATAEVASTFMEDFVSEELGKEKDDEFRLALMMTKLNNDITSIFRQVACYLFERELHEKFREKGYLSKEEIGEVFSRHMFDYLGAGVEKSAGSENWWSSWHHIRYFFYVYSYSSGLLISKYLQKKVRENKEFVGKVKEFLSAGLSNSPRNIFLKLGIDIRDENFWHEGISEVEKLLNDCKLLARKLGKI